MRSFHDYAMSLAVVLLSVCALVLVGTVGYGLATGHVHSRPRCQVFVVGAGR